MNKKIKKEIASAAGQTGKTGIIFWYIVRIMLLAGLVSAETSSRRYFILGTVALTFAVSALRLVFKPQSFFGSLSYKVQTLVCVAAFFNTVIGKIMGVLERFPDYDVFLQLLMGAVGVALGYYITVALNEPKTKGEITFTVFSSLSISATVACITEIAEFLLDFWRGTNLVHVDILADDHWFYRLFGKGMTELIPNQQRLYDTDEDMLLAVLAAFVATAVLYIWLRIKNKALYNVREKKVKSPSMSIVAFIKKKFADEKQKINNDCDIWDVLIWWMVRGVMLYAAFNMVTAEAILLSANLLGTFAITLLHLFTPSNSALNKLSYRVQTVITLIVFLGSYCGNYVFLYNILARYDLFLHFISGAMSVTAGYYLSKVFITVTNKKQAFLSALFPLCFSGLVIPTHEIVEFIGDFIWGTTNQGFNWGPADNSFFFKIFGHGAGNTDLYYLFDTMYDMLLASSMAIISSATLFVFLIYKLKRDSKKAAVGNEGEKSEFDKLLMS